MTIDEVFKKTDWVLLRKQKAALVEAVGNSESRLLDGLLGFLDAVTDAASDAGYPVYAGRKAK